MNGLTTCTLAVALLGSMPAHASVCPTAVTGLDRPLGQTVDPTTIFDQSNGELEVVQTNQRGEMASFLPDLTGATMLMDLHNPVWAQALGLPQEPADHGASLGSYIEALRPDSLLALSHEQHGATNGEPGESCLLCLPNAPARTEATLADLAAEPFDPLLYAGAALPRIEAEPIPSAPIVASADLIGPNFVAFVLPPDLSKRNPMILFGLGGVIILVVRLRRSGKLRRQS